jgi:DNA-directed RNA polymerase subunit RPC12/RpoP
VGFGIECVPFWKLRGSKKSWKFEPESPSNSDNDDESKTESDSSEESDTGTESDEEECEEKRRGDVMDPVKKGTQIKMRSLQLLEGIGTITCMKIKVVVHCSRCKESCDLKLSANRAVGTTCAKCNHQMLVNFRPAMMHQMSHNLGYLDVDGCKASDVILMDGVFDLGCRHYSTRSR